MSAIFTIFGRGTPLLALSVFRIQSDENLTGCLMTRPMRPDHPPEPRLVTPPVTPTGPAVAAPGVDPESAASHLARTAHAEAICGKLKL